MTTDTPQISDYDLVVVGGTAGGLSVAVSSLRSGIPSVRVVVSGHSVVFPELVGPDELDVGYGEDVIGIDSEAGSLVVRTSKHTYRTTACLIADRHLLPDWRPPLAGIDSPRVGVDVLPAHIRDTDVLVVGHTDHAVELVAEAVTAGARVVMAAGGMDPNLLSPAGDHMLRRLERERRATILYRAVPQELVDSDGYPMVYFKDRQTPDLQFDHVVFASNRATLQPEDVGLTDAALKTGHVWFLGEPVEGATPTTAPGWRIGQELGAACFPEIPISPPVDRRLRDEEVAEQLRTELYNATITHFEPTHSDLWVLRVKPDYGSTSFVPGQYATLGLGYWEERVDGAEEAGLGDKWDKLVRRSYSISSRVFDEIGYLTDEGGLDEVELYIVLVPPGAGRIPSLTPRLALKRPGDRIYLGPKVAGRYTLAPVTDPAGTVVFLATGTGEAPHNAMIVELLRKGHYGPIVSVVTVRALKDLGYLEKHTALAERYSNYHYITLPTREPDIPKRYIQDLIQGEDLSELGVGLDPENTHVFLCGNPAMIGMPEGDAYPTPVGVIELLTERGFKLDRRGQPGNIHVEEYW